MKKPRDAVREGREVRKPDEPPGGSLRVKGAARERREKRVESGEEMGGAELGTRN
jgi:hypothetical protein